MKAPHFLLLVLVLMWCVLTVAAIQSGPQHDSQPHPVYGRSGSVADTITMDVGGQPYAGPWAWLFGCLTIFVLSGFMWLATDGVPVAGLLRLLIAAGTGLFLAVFSVMCWSDHQYAGRSTPLWGALPEPTQWMITGIWFAPMVFMLIYVLGFRRWFSSSDPLPESKSAESA